MLSFFTRFGPSSVILLYLLNWVLKLKYVLFPDLQREFFNVSEYAFFQFPNIYNFAIAHPSLYTILSIHAIFVLALIINTLCVQEKIAAKNTLLPAFSIVVLSSLLSVGFLLSFYYVIALLFIGVLKLIFSSNSQAGSTNKLFMAGVLMGFIIMYKPVFIISLPFMVFIIIGIKSVHGKSIFAYLLGSIIPLYLFASAIWIFNPGLLPKFKWVNPKVPHIIYQPENIVIAIVAILWFCIHAYFLKQNRSEIGGIQTEKKWLGLRISWTAAILCSLFGNMFPSMSLFIWLLVSAILLFPCFNLILNKKWANFTCYFLIIVVLINQYIFIKN